MTKMICILHVFTSQLL